MEGRESTTNNHVSRLTVRAGDGSNFWFDALTVHYEIIPGDAEIILQDSGPGDSYKEEWIRAHARSILRDEFGRYSAVEVANPTVYNAAPIEAAARLNEVLAPHGIRVTKIPVPDPKFDPEYERAIETRKEADQEIQRLREGTPRGSGERDPGQARGRRHQNRARGGGPRIAGGDVRARAGPGGQVPQGGRGHREAGAGPRTAR